MHSSLSGKHTAWHFPMVRGDARPSCPELDALLREFVDGRGRVCYGAWHADCAARARLLAYLDSLGSVDAEGQSASMACRLALYINAYNALTIWSVLRDYPTASVQLLNRPTAPYRIFDDLELSIGGR